MSPVISSLGGLQVLNLFSRFSFLFIRRFCYVLRVSIFYSKIFSFCIRFFNLLLDILSHLGGKMFSLFLKILFYKYCFTLFRYDLNHHFFHLLISFFLLCFQTCQPLSFRDLFIPLCSCAFYLPQKFLLSQFLYLFSKTRFPFKFCISED